MPIGVSDSRSSPRTSSPTVTDANTPHRRGATAHYEDGRYYDQTYRLRRHDVRYYADLAEEIGGPVLELGSGTGRVALAIAERGIDVVAVESMAPMLARCRERLSRLPKKTSAHLILKQGDLRGLRLRRRFPLVLAPFNVWNHLYERRDLERAFRTVHVHLRRGGLFAFDVLLPDPGSLARPPNRRYRGGHVRHPKDGVRYRYSEYFTYDPLTQVQTVMLDFEHPEDASRSFCTPLTQRQFFPAEIEALLAYNGFTVERHEGDFDGDPLTAQSESQVILARKRGR